MKTQLERKIELVYEFRQVIANKNSKLIDVQAELIKGEYTREVFDMLQDVISDNFKLWDELFELENKMR
jgi:hypothetical protein